MANYKIVVEGEDKLTAELTARAAEIPLKTRRLLSELGQYVEFAAKGLAPHRTANLAKNIKFEGIEEPEPGVFVGVVGIRKTAPYGRFVEKGTGLWGENPHWIFPKQGNFMAWEERGDFATAYHGRYVSSYPLIPKSVGFLIIAKQTKGQKPQRFLEHAFEDMKATYLPERLHALANDI